MKVRCPYNSPGDLELAIPVWSTVLGALCNRFSQLCRSWVEGGGGDGRTPTPSQGHRHIWVIVFVIVHIWVIVFVIVSGQYGNELTVGMN